MKKAGILFFVLLISSGLFAQNESVSAYALSMGYIGQTDRSVFSVFYNQAQLSGIKGFSGGIYYQNFFSLPDYDLKSLALAYGMENSGTIAFDFYTIGIPGYTEQKAGLAYGMKLFEKFSAGIQLNFHIINQPDLYGDLYTATAELSLKYQINDAVALYANVFNLWYGLLRSENLPVVLSTAMEYKFSDKAFLALEVQKNATLPVAYKWGARYNIVDNLSIRVGGRYQGQIYAYTIGVAYSYKFMTIALSFANQPYIGMTGGGGTYIQF